MGGLITHRHLSMSYGMQNVLLQALQHGLKHPHLDGMIPQLNVADVPFLSIALQAIAQAL